MRTVLLAKAQVKAHTRTLPSGKVVQVKAYDDGRVKKANKSAEKVSAKSISDLVGDAQTIDVDGTDRPTKNSDGQPIHPTVEGVRNFWRWFGDSKMVDDDGRPLIVKHGSREVFSEFKEKHGGMYFSQDGSTVTAVFTESGQGDVGEFYVRAEKPFDARWNNMSSEAKSELREIIESRVDESDIEDAAAKLEVDLEEADPFEVFTDGEFFWGYGRQLQDSVIDAIRQRGYDGVIFPDALTFGESHTSYVVFKPSQIKSATDNDGNFDPSSSDLTKSFALLTLTGKQ